MVVNEKKKHFVIVLFSFQGGQQARFDMNGKVVPVDADVPTNLGLHHHGHEPEVGG